MKIAFILYDGFSTLDFASVYEPLTRLKTMGLVSDLVWELCSTSEKITDSQGMLYHPTMVNQPISGYDLIVIPGSPDVDKPLSDEQLLSWLDTAGKTPWLAAIGKGSLLLAAIDILQNKRVAADPENFAELEKFGVLPVAEPLVEDDAIFTAANSSAALKLGISLCAQLAGLGAAEKVRSRLGEPTTASALSTELTSDQPSESGEALRYARVVRKTRETTVEVELEIDGCGKYDILSGLPFLDHMLAQVAVHGLFNLSIKAKGDLEVDPHHTVEDIALALGQAFQEALGDRGGIVRMASAHCPMDESLAWVSVDLSGRPYAVVQADWQVPSVGGLPVSLFSHFMESFSIQARCNLHARILYGNDGHHQAEALFKAFGRALDTATQIDPRREGDIPSSKGTL